MLDDYYEDVVLFKKIDAHEADKLLNGDEKEFIYIGRASCPYCRKFAAKLSNAVEKTNTVIHYVDSENDDDDFIKSFRNKFNILTVPGFIVKKNGEIDVRCDSSIPEEELVDILS